MPSATVIIEPLPSKTITAKYAHDALNSFEKENGKIGRNLMILRKEYPARDIILRKNLGSVNLTMRQNLDAVFVQINGKKAAAECELCKRGPFVGCIQHPEVGDGACANCLYKRHGNCCTHRVLMDTDSDDILPSQHRKRQEPPQEPNLPAPATKKNVKKRRRTIEVCTEAATETATQLEAPIPLPAHYHQPLQPLLGPTPVATPPTVTSQTQVGKPPIHVLGAALGSAADHWLKSLALSKYASPAPTQGQDANKDYAPSSGHFENNDYALSQAPVVMRDNNYAPSPTPFKANVNDNLDHDTIKPMLAYLPRNVSPEVLRSIAQYHQDLADDLRMEAKRLEKEMRQEHEREREREREWGAQVVRQARYE